MPESTMRITRATAHTLQGWLKSVCLVVLACLCFPIYGVGATPCNQINTVLTSAMPANNTEAGGHVLKHITGETPPPNKTNSQKNATMFADTNQYLAIWGSYASVPGVICPNGLEGAKKSEEVAVSELRNEDMLKVCQCGANVGADGKCQHGYFNFSTTITFVFKVVNSQWILLTAYPQSGAKDDEVCVGGAITSAKKKSPSHSSAP